MDTDIKEFTNQENLHRIYDAILPDENGKQEIHNPSRLRFFTKCINRQEIRIQLEKGVLLDDIDYDFDAETRVKKIKDFTSFTRKLSNVSDQELELFQALHTVLETLLVGEGK